MTLAERFNLSDQRWYVPAAFVIASFAVGIQVALIWQAMGDASYPPQGKEALGWGSLSALVILAALHAPASRQELDQTLQPLSNLWTHLQRGRRILVLRRLEAQEGATNGTPPEAADEPLVQPAPQRLKVRIHSPLMVGPVVAPGESVPIQVRAEPAELAGDLSVTFRIEDAKGTRQTTGHMTGTDLVHTETFEAPGPFTVSVEVEHPEGQPASKTLEGRVASYREEVGRLFDRVREQAMAQGLDIGPQSTPREVCKALPTMANASYEDAQALRTHLEIALYGDGAVDRPTYEAIHTLLREVGLGEEVAP